MSALGLNNHQDRDLIGFWGHGRQNLPVILGVPGKERKSKVKGGESSLCLEICKKCVSQSQTNHYDYQSSRLGHAALKQ